MWARKRTTDLEDLEQRIAALERQLEDGKDLNKRLWLALDCWLKMVEQFAEDFGISSPEFDSALAKFKAMG